MSDPLKHECGIGMIRLRKPLGYYIEKYGTPAYGINKLFLLMEKQHNRGQDGAGIGTITLNPTPGVQYINRQRSIASQPIVDIFKQVGKKFEDAQKLDPEKYKSARWVKDNVPFAAELMVAHVRYATYGKHDVHYCHPKLRPSNWRGKNLLLAGNFNLTNNNEIFQELQELGQHPKEKVDTVSMLEKISHFLGRQYNQLRRVYEEKGELTDREIALKVEEELNLQQVLERSCRDFDGGYSIVGLCGHGDSFVARDPAGIRPAYFYADDEVIVAASEKPAIKLAFGVEFDDIREVRPGHALLIDKEANFEEVQFIEPVEKKSCSFERIYFSRGTDPAIYNERKALGRLLVPQILEAVDNDLENTVFSYIPNTAETAFLGMMQGLDEHLSKQRIAALKEGKSLDDEALERLFAFRPRVEKMVIKDTKLRSFITGDDQRDEFVAHIYDTTYGIVRPRQDSLVVIDDSIVRGTTLQKSIIHMLAKLKPKRIVIVSSAPQIRFPDCYGIDMSRQQEFIVFRATLELLKENNLYYLLEEVYEKCKASSALSLKKVINHVKEVYAPFGYEQISDKVAEIVAREVNDPELEVKVVFQTVENLHRACPDHLGDWYFTGNFPTPGGNRVANRAFMNYMEGKNERAY